MRGKFKQPQQQKGADFAAPITFSESTEQLCPVFSLRFLRRDFCISSCSEEEKVSFVDKMHKLSQLTWAQIKSTHRHGLGCEKIEKSSIKAPIPSVVTDEVTLLAFRFCGLAPMVGYRDRDVFHILWFDREFTLYPHG